MAGKPPTRRHPGAVSISLSFRGFSSTATLPHRDLTPGYVAISPLCFIKAMLEAQNRLRDSKFQFMNSSGLAALRLFRGYRRAGPEEIAGSPVQ
jgi:hypothetical protein